MLQAVLRGHSPLVLLAVTMASCSSDPDLPAKATDAAAESATDALADTPIDTAPPDCGSEPLITYSLNLGVIDSTGPHLAKGIQARSTLCGAGLFATSDALGKTTMRLTKSTPQVMRFTSKFSVPGIDGELVLDTDDFRPGYMLLDSESTGALPGYDATLGTLWVQVEQLESDACTGRGGVTISVPSAPGAKVSYLAGYKPTKDGLPSDEGLAVVTKVPLGTAIEVKATRAGCNVTTAGRGYTGKYTTEAGAITYVMAWLIK